MSDSINPTPVEPGTLSNISPHNHDGLNSPQVSYANLTSKPTIPAIPVPIASGGTGQVTASAAFDALAPTTTRGDIIARGASSNGRVAIGGANTVIHGGTDPSYSAVVEADITLADNTTNNATSANHGFVKKLPNDATLFYDGTGNYTAPTGGVTLVQSGSNITVANTTALSDIFSYSVAANKLGTTKGYRVKLWVSNLKNATNSVDLLFKYGSSFSDINLGSQNLNRPGVWECTLIADGATNKQRLMESFMAVANGITQGTNLNFAIDQTNPTEDSTTALNLKCQVQFSSASANDTITIYAYTLEFLT